jgi:hypothetical protein
LLGRYLRRTVEADARLTRVDVIPWPDLQNEEIVAVTIDDEPNWLMLNKGSIVDVWMGQNRATPQYAMAQAIVPSGTKWAVVLRREDFATDSLSSTENPILRLVRLPHKPPPAPKPPPPPSKP